MSRVVLAEVSERDLAAAPARSVRRATARRPSNRRATARNRQRDSKARASSSIPGAPPGISPKA